MRFTSARPRSLLTIVKICADDWMIVCYTLHLRAKPVRTVHPDCCFCLRSWCKPSCGGVQSSRTQGCQNKPTATSETCSWQHPRNWHVEEHHPGTAQHLRWEVKACRKKAVSMSLHPKCVQGVCNKCTPWSCKSQQIRPWGLEGLCHQSGAIFMSGQGDPGSFWFSQCYIPAQPIPY